MIVISVVGGMIPVVLGIFLMSIGLFWSPLFMYALGLTIFRVQKMNRITLIFLVAALILYVIAQLREPEWLNLLKEEISML